MICGGVQNQFGIRRILLQSKNIPAMCKLVAGADNKTNVEV